MSDVTPICNIQIPVLSDVPDIETAIHPMANTIDSLLTMRYATVTERNTANPTPTEGQQCYVSATGELYIYNGTAWVGAKPRTIVQTVDREVVDSVTLAGHPDFLWSVEANSKYEILGSLRWKSVFTEGNNIKFAINVPSGGNGSWGLYGPDSTISAGTVYNHGTAHAENFYNTGYGYGVLSTELLRGMIHGHLIIGSTPGNVQLQFAELGAVGGVTKVVVAQYSHMELRKIG